MKRHNWYEPRSGSVGSGKGRSHCLSCGLIRWTVAAQAAITLTDLYSRDAITWSVVKPPCPERVEPTEGASR